jgi:hypothetical protein
VRGTAVVAAALAAASCAQLLDTDDYRHGGAGGAAAASLASATAGPGGAMPVVTVGPSSASSGGASSNAVTASSSSTGGGCVGALECVVDSNAFGLAPCNGNIPSAACAPDLWNYCACKASIGTGMPPILFWDPPMHMGKKPTSFVLVAPEAMAPYSLQIDNVCLTNPDGFCAACGNGLSLRRWTTFSAALNPAKVSYQVIVRAGDKLGTCVSGSSIPFVFTWDSSL